MRDLLYIFSFTNFIMAIVLLKYYPDGLFFAWLLFPLIVFINMLRIKVKKWL